MLKLDKGTQIAMPLALLTYYTIPTFVLSIILSCFVCLYAQAAKFARFLSEKYRPTAILCGGPNG